MSRGMSESPTATISGSSGTSARRSAPPPDGCDQETKAANDNGERVLVDAMDRRQRLPNLHPRVRARFRLLPGSISRRNVPRRNVPEPPTGSILSGRVARRYLARA